MKSHSATSNDLFAKHYHRETIDKLGDPLLHMFLGLYRKWAAL